MDICARVRGRLVAFEAGDVGEGEAAEIRAHLGACADCRKVHENISKSLEGVREASDEEVPAGLAERAFARVKAEIEAGEKRRFVKLVRFSWVDALASVAACLILAVIILPILGKSVDTADRAACEQQLRLIGQAAASFRDGFGGGTYPQGTGRAFFGELVKVGAPLHGRERLFMCPGAKEHSGGVSYRGPARSVVGALDSDRAVACDYLENHGKVGVNVLFGDWHVEWISRGSEWYAGVMEDTTE